MSSAAWNEFGTPPNKAYDKFFNEISSIDALPISDWKHKHLIGYICKKYFNVYGTVYKLSCGTTAPSKSREMHEINRLKYLLSSDILLLKGYIDWVFDNKISKKTRRVTSFRFVTNEGSVNSYKNDVLLNLSDNNIDRTTELPADIKDVLRLYNYTYSTFGELSMLSADTNSKQVMDKLAEMGFDLSVLEKVV